MTVAKQNAERYGAEQRAESQFCNALNLLAHADDLTDQHSFSEACKIYDQARIVFEESRNVLIGLEIPEEETRGVQGQIKSCARTSRSCTSQGTGV